MNIVFFDSGVGGLTVLREACRKFPAERYVYYADTLNVPYGVHTKQEVSAFVAACIDHILSTHEVKALVLACNTATSAAVETLRDRYPFPIVGMEPAVKPAIQLVRGTARRVLVTATPLTLKEEKFQRLLRRLDDPDQVDLLGLPGLVSFAENGTFDGPEVAEYLRAQLAPFQPERLGAIVLGCTHFVMFKQAIRRIVPEHVQLVDGNAGTVNQLARLLQLEPRDKGAAGSGGEAQIAFMSSRRTTEDGQRLESFYRGLA
ncbi:MAG: glutamate racemase [Paenibacillus sp.]|jgi:glutamate racemase|nr:glutamate racemase [Paenibacillus sp.]